MILHSTLLIAKVIYVDCKYVGNIFNGTPESPYLTLTDAVKNAQKDDTIFIAEGFYDENSEIKINFGLSIIGSDKENTILKNSFDINAIDSCSRFFISKLSFQNFTFFKSNSEPYNKCNAIHNCSINCITILNSGGQSFSFLECDIGGVVKLSQGIAPSVYNIEKCKIKGDLKISLDSGQSLFLKNNQFENNILTDKSSYCNIEIMSNVFSNSRLEIYGKNTSRNLIYQIKNNTISTSSSNVAIIVTGGFLTIQNNNISCFDRASGIYIISGDEINITGNSINVGVDGTFGILANGKSGTIRFNEIKGGLYGIYNQLENSRCDWNKITNSNEGIIIGETVAMTSNKIYNCKGNGVIVFGASGYLTGNVIENNSGSGIIIKRGISDWGKPIIDLGGGRHASPGKNVIRNNGNYDLKLESSFIDNAVIYAKNNYWDHQSIEEIDAFDIFDGADSDSLAKVEFTPFFMVNNYGDESIDKDLITVYPNPFIDEVTLKINSNTEKPIFISILNYLGNIIPELCNQYYSQGVYQFNFKTFTDGIYFVQYSYNEKNYLIPIIKTK